MGADHAIRARGHAGEQQVTLLRIARAPDFLEARARHLEEEQRRERVLPREYILPQWIRPTLGREKPP